MDPDRFAARAAIAVLAMPARWHALAIVAELTVEWPARCRMDAAPSSGHAVELLRS